MDTVSRLFFDQGSIEDFRKLIDEDPVHLTKILFHIRDKKYGLGHRALFVNLFTITTILMPEAVKLIEFIPKYGSWKDLVLIANADDSLSHVIALYFLLQFRRDLLNIRSNKKISNAAKWFPTPRGKKRNIPLVKHMLKLIGGNEAMLRRHYLSPLRHYLGLVEIKMSKGHYDEINYDKMPSVAKKKYATALWRNAPEIFQAIRFNDIVEIIMEVIKGYEGDVNREWNRLSKCTMGNSVAVICDVACKKIQYLIAIALSFNKCQKYTYDYPPKKIEMNSTDIRKNIISFADVKCGDLLTFSNINEGLIYVITNKPILMSLKDYPSKVIVWWNIDSPCISMTTHSASLIEINGFHLKILNHLIKGGYPKIDLIVQNNLKRY